MEFAHLIERLSERRSAFIDDLAQRLTVSEARWNGDPQTVVRIDCLLPPLLDATDPGLAKLDDAARADDSGNRRDPRDRARWQLRTGGVPHLYGFPASSDVMGEFHRADAQKGRRLIVRDLDAGHIAALLAWHFEHGPRDGPARSRRKRLRPHLITSLAVRQDARGSLRGEYMVMLWYLSLTGLAIDRLTIARGRVGVSADSGIALEQAELDLLGFRKGPSSKHGGYADRGYFEISA